MDHDNKPLKCELNNHEVVVNNDLRISFCRTIRVPDNNQQESCLPPDLGGAFLLKSVEKYGKKMQAEMTAKVGIFFPMYRKCEDVRLLGNG
jgi:hypothetical protein